MSKRKAKPYIQKREPSTSAKRQLITRMESKDGSFRVDTNDPVAVESVQRYIWKFIDDRFIPFINAHHRHVQNLRLAELVSVALFARADREPIQREIERISLDTALAESGVLYERLTPSNVVKTESFQELKRYTGAYITALQRFIKKEDTGESLIEIGENTQGISDLFEEVRIQAEYEHRTIGAPKLPGREYIAIESRQIEESNPGIKTPQVAHILLGYLDNRELTKNERDALERFQKAKNKEQYLRDCQRDYPQRQE